MKVRNGIDDEDIALPLCLIYDYKEVRKSSRFSDE
jgi:hypothetical protein